MSQIPEDVKKKIEDERDEYLQRLRISSASIDKMRDTHRSLGFMTGAEYGYSLASEEVKALRDGKLFHWCQSADKVRPYPSLLCSACRGVIDGSNDFNPVEELKALREENEKLKEELTTIKGYFNKPR